MKRALVAVLFVLFFVTSASAAFFSNGKVDGYPDITYSNLKINDDCTVTLSLTSKMQGRTKFLGRILFTDIMGKIQGSTYLVEAELGSVNIKTSLREGSRVEIARKARGATVVKWDEVVVR
jgi:hypothetical protein